jgi:hypothetical protein
MSLLKNGFQTIATVSTSFYHGYKLSFTFYITIQAAGFHCGIEVNIYSIYQLDEVVIFLFAFISFYYYH